MKIVTLVIFTLLLLSYSHHLQCTKGLINFYRYESEITGAKGKKQMHLKALVTTSCHGTKKFEGKEVMVMVMVTANVEVYHEGNHTAKVPYDKSFEKTVTFLQDRKGDILSVIYDKDEKQTVLSIKKSILSNFVVKLAGESSEEDTQAGKVRFLYEKAILKKGKNIIRKKAVQVLQQPDPSMKRKDQKYNQVSYIQLHPDGKIHNVYTEQGTSVGKSSKRAKEKYQKKKDNLGHVAHPDDYQEKAGDAFEFAAKSTLYLVKTGKLDGDKIKLKKKPKNPDQVKGTKTLTLEDYHKEFDDTQQVSNLSLEPALIQEVFEIRKQSLAKEVHFPTLLQKVREDPHDHNLLAKAHDYVSTLQDEALDHVIEEYSKLSVEKELNYALSLISLFTVAQSEKGQDQLIKAMENKLTAQQAIVNSLGVKNPSEKLINTLQRLSNEKFHDLDETDNHFINTNAYLAYVHTASKSYGERSHRILEEISDNIEKVQTLREFEKEVHALSNAGEIVPLEAITVIAVNEHLPLDLRVAAIKGLGFRTSLDSHEQVTNLLQHLTESTYNEAIRTAAVHALTQREAEIQDASSLEFLKQYLEDVDTPSTLVHAIKEYNLEVDSEHAHGILEATKLGSDHHIGERAEAVKVMQLEGYFDETEDEVNSLEARPLGWGWSPRRFFRRIGGGFRSAFRRIGGGFRTAFRRIGGGFRSAFRRIGGGFRRFGGFIRRAASRVGRFVKRIGSDIKRVARKVGRAIVKIAKKVYNKTIGAVVGKVKSFIKGIKDKFSAASFKGEQICIQSNSKGDRICMYDEDMVAFIRKQGDLTSLKWSKQFSFEKLLGVQIMNVYIGMVGYAGTHIDCATNSFDIVIFGRGAAKAKLFGRRVPIVTAELELQKLTGQDLVDRAYVSVYKAVIFNHQFVPEKIRKYINACEKNTRPLIKPVKKPLLNFSFTIVVVVVPLSFSISVTAEMGVDLVTIICPSRLTLTASVQPYIGVGISAQAGIGFAVVSGGVQASFQANYRLKPSFGTSNCNLCALLKHEVKPIRIAISLYLKAVIKTWNVQLFNFNGPLIKGTLFKYCLFKNKPYDPESVLNGPPPDQSSQDSQDPSSDQGSGDQSSQDQGSGDQSSQDQGSGDQSSQDQGSGDQSSQDQSSASGSQTPAPDQSSGSISPDQSSGSSPDQSLGSSDQTAPDQSSSSSSNQDVSNNQQIVQGTKRPRNSNRPRYPNRSRNSNRPRYSNRPRNSRPRNSRPRYSNNQRNSNSPSYQNSPSQSSPTIVNVPQNVPTPQPEIIVEQRTVQPPQYSPNQFIRPQRNVQPKSQNNLPEIQRELSRIEKLVKNQPKPQRVQQRRPRVRVPRLPIRSVQRSMRRNMDRERREIRRSENRIEHMIERNRLSNLLRDEERRSSSLIRRLNRRVMNELRSYEEE